MYPLGNSERYLWLIVDTQLNDKIDINTSKIKYVINIQVFSKEKVWN